MKNKAMPWKGSEFMTELKVSLMSLEVEGACRRAIDLYWLHGTLPANVNTLAQLIGKNCNTAAASKVREYFKVDPANENRLVHPGIDAQRKKATEWAAKSALGGKTSRRKVVAEPPKPKTIAIKTEGPSIEAVREVFEEWKTVLDHPKAVLDAKRTKLIKDRLQHYSAEDLKRVVRGVRASPFHMGENDRKKRYDSIGLIFRDNDHVDDFLQIAPKEEASSGPSKIALIDSCQLCDDEGLVTKLNDHGRMQAFLCRHGGTGCEK